MLFDIAILQQTSIKEILDDVDSRALLLINHAHSDMLDEVMWLISDRWIWIPMYMFLVFWVYHRLGATKCLVVAVLTGVLMLLTDQTCTYIIRPWIERLRPSCLENPISDMVRVVNGYRGGRYGFPSCHAANTFALAVFLSLCLKSRIFTCSIFLWALVVSYSRPYLGIHYPGDIIGGWIIGGVFALFVYYIYYGYQIHVAEWSWA